MSGPTVNERCKTYPDAIEEIHRLRDALETERRLLDCRAGKLLRKGKNFLVVACDEPYYMRVYHMIRNREIEIGRWTEEDEQEFAKAQAAYGETK